MRSIRPIEPPEIPASGGTISAVQVQKKDADRCNIFLDGSFAFGLHMNIVAEHGLRKGKRLDEEQCRSLVESDTYFKALKRCVDYLAYRPRTQQEIDRRLKDLQVSDAIAQQVSDRLNELGYLDDERFALQWAASRQRSKGFGPRRLEVELIRKGIPSALAKRAVSEVCSEESVEDSLSEQLQKAMHRYRRESDASKRERKILGFLTRRGFDPGAIRDALRTAEG